MAPKFFVSGSEDCTLKLWTIPDDLDTSETKEVHAQVTEIAHQKTITSVAVAPNDKFIASGSMDKTAKVIIHEKENDIHDYFSFLYSSLIV